METVAMPPMRARPSGSSLLVGMAALDHPGRVRDKSLMSALGWATGDRTSVRVASEMSLVRRDRGGRFRIDSRGQVFIPSGTRALFDISPGERVVLVAELERQLLIIHPAAFVVKLLADCYSTLPGGLDAR